MEERSMEERLSKQKTIKLPRTLLDKLERYIDAHPELGYLSSTEYIRECLRLKIKDEFKDQDL